MSFEPKSGPLSRASNTFGLIILVASIMECAMCQTTPELTLSKPLYDFGGKLLAELGKQDAKGNIVMSPISIHQALSVTLLGANRGSETRRELLRTIGYDQLSEADIERYHESYADVMSKFSNITNETMEERKKFAKKPNKRGEYFEKDAPPRTPVLDIFTMLVTKNKAEFKPEFARAARRYYHASLSNIKDNEPKTKENLLKKLNSWGEKAGFHSPIMQENELNEDFEALLITAIQAEAFWFDQFYEGNEEKIFYNHGQKDKPVQGQFLAMSDPPGSSYIEFTSSERAKYKRLHKELSQDETFQQLSGLNAKVLRMNLIGNLSIVIFEPLNDESDSSTEFMDTLNKLTENLFSSFEAGTESDAKQTNLEKILDVLDEPVGGSPDYVKMPKFNFESDIDLKSALESLGLRRVFSRKSQLSNITNEHLYISNIQHKAMIETTKTGIKAAGVTIIKFSALSAVITPNERIVVDIENPFLFVLRYKQVPLFFGRLTNLDTN